MAKYIPIECSMRKGANIFFRIKAKLKKIFHKSISDPFAFPIIINNYNRLGYLQKQITWLENAGYHNIYIIDNCSTYEPLLAYYDSLPYTIYKLDRNKGFRSIWETHLILNFEMDYYVYTDPDILPSVNCPSDILSYMKNLLAKYTDAGKIGFSLAIDDLPDYYILKDKVIAYEETYWKNKINDEVYEALIDTTFALYRPYAKGDWQLKAYRTAYPYTAHHLPWYENTSVPDEEEIFYIEHSNKNSLWYSNLKQNTKSE